MHTIQAISHLIENNQTVAYLLIFLITMLEGELIAISAGILVLLGALNFWIALLAVFAGAALKTFLGYALGKFLNKRFNHNKLFQYIEKKVHAVMPHFEERPFWSIFFSKFLMVNHVVILFAGYRRINFKRYLKAEMFSTLIWAPTLLALGYFFSYTAFRISRKLSEFLLIIMLFVIAFFLLEKIVSLLYDVFENMLHDHEGTK